MARPKQFEAPISIAEVEEYYREINRRGFGGILPDKLPIRFVATTQRAARALAKVKHTLTKRERTFDRWKGSYLDHSSLAIELSISVNRTADRLKALLLHEMIHIWFYLAGEYEETHGPAFMAKLRELERLTGLEIPVTEEVAKEDLNLHNTKVGVIVVQHAGRTTFAILTAKAVQESLDAIFERIKKYDANSRVKVYLSTSRMMQELTLTMKTQRTYSYKTKFYSFRTPDRTREVLHDLEDTGTLLRSE